MATGTEVARLFVRVGADVSEAVAGLTLVGRKVTSLEDTLRRAAGTLTTAGAALTVGLTLPILKIGQVTAETAATFEQKMNLIAAISGSTESELADLSSAVLSVGRSAASFGQDALGAADATTELLKAGLTTEQIFGDIQAVIQDGSKSAGALQAATELASASTLDMGQSAEFVVQVMSTYKTEAGDLDGVIDHLVRTANASVLEMEDLMGSWKNAAPTAAIFGLSLEDLNTSLAIMSQHGVRGAEAGTALKRMFTNIQRPTKAVTEAMADLGLTLYDSSGNIKDIRTIVGEFSDALFGSKAQAMGMTEQMRNQYIQTIAGVYGMKALNALMVGGLPAWDAMTQAISGQATAEEIGAAKLKGFKGQVALLQKALVDLKIKAGLPILNEFLTPLVTKITAVVQKLAGLDPAIYLVAARVAIFVAVIGPLLLTLGALAFSVSALLNPIGLAIVAFFALGASFAATMTKGDAMTKRLAGIGPFLKDMIAKLQTLQQSWARTWEGIARATLPSLANLVAYIRGKLEEARTIVVWQLERVVRWIKDNLTQIRQIVSGGLALVMAVWDKVWAFLRNNAEFIWDTISGLVESGMEIVRRVMLAAMAIVGTDWSDTWERIKTIVRTVLGDVVPFVIQEVGLIVNWIRTNLPDIKDAFNNVLDAILIVWKATWPIIAFILDTALKGILIALDIALDLINGNWAAAWDKVKMVAQAVWDFISPYIKGAMTSVKDWVLGKAQELQAAWPGIWGNIQDKAVEIWGNIRARAVEIWGMIRQETAELWGQIAEWIRTKSNEAWIWARAELGKIYDWVLEKFPIIGRTVDWVMTEIVPFIRDKSIEARGFFMQEWQKITDWADRNMPLIHQTVVRVMNDTVASWQEKWLLLKPIVDFVWEQIQKTVDTALSILLKALDLVMIVVNADWSEQWDALYRTVKTITTDVIEFLGPWLNDVRAFFLREFGVVVDWVKENLPLIQTTISNVLGGIERLWKAVWPSLKNILIFAWEEIKIVVGTAIEQVLSLIKIGMLLINGDWAGAWEEFKTVLTRAWDGTKQALKLIWDGIARGFSDWWHNDFFTIIDRLYTPIVDKITAPFRAIKSEIERIWQDISRIISNIAFPQIKLPHFIVTQQRTGIDLFPTIPVIHVEWYGQGVDAVFNKPTLIGVGEKGAERVQVTPLGRGGGGSNSTTNNNNQREFSYNITIQASPENVMPAMRALLMKLQMGTTG